MKYNLKKGILSLAAVCTVLCTLAQQKEPIAIKLKVGDIPPPLKVEKWVKGVPVQEFEKNQVYVLEFWATWCGPCRAVMPHLSELAKQYAGKVTFIGVDIWESIDHPAGMSYEELMAGSTQLVADMGDKMAYNVAQDTRDDYMGNNWMKAAGQFGIPSTFLIQGGKLAWIGHPKALDKVLKDMLAGTYDMEAFAGSFNKKTETDLTNQAAQKAVLKPVYDAIAVKDTTRVLLEIDKAIIANPSGMGFLRNMKLQLLLDKRDIPQALAFAREWQKKNGAMMGLYISPMIAKKDGLPGEAYQLAVDFAKESLPLLTKGTDDSNGASVYNDIATCYFKMGDKIKAADAQEKAIELSRKAALLGVNGYYTPTILKEFEASLVRYKAAK